MNPPTPFVPSSRPKQFVLCFDGTGNKFCGDESDSNVLKIFRVSSIAPAKGSIRLSLFKSHANNPFKMLDRSKSHQYHYYQPGIGTYVTTRSLSSHGRYQRIRSAYLKAKDSAVGSSFADHVMGGYKFLMRYYAPGDEIYFIGFSRGSYIARFLAEMLDYVGLLEAGNEELIRFAWKTFAKWQQRRNDSEEDRIEREKLFHYMKAFRETFSRPVSRIRFMGLFDTVNSVPKFESAWMQRSKFPYTARSSAAVIRHAVGIDERRAKFRQDLISGQKPGQHKKHHHIGRPHLHHHHQDAKKGENVPNIVLNDGSNNENNPQESRYGQQGGSSSVGNRYRPSSREQNISLAVPGATASTEDLTSVRSGQTGQSLQVPATVAENEDSQDIQEVWFPGCHADIGGGWKLAKGEVWPLSHAPLVWMVQEAQKAGLQFDPSKLKQFECCEEFDGDYTPIRKEWDYRKGHQKPSDSLCRDGDAEKQTASSLGFHQALNISSTSGVLHDCLDFGSGLPAMSVLAWRIMEYLPFRRMDLQDDGSWKPIRWPLPCGEVRDIPSDAQIHISALRRLQNDGNYRPGNLIVGGGGRGIRRAPEEYGIGEWVPFNFEGDDVRETFIRKSASKECKDEHH